jgi:hypothetical protein
VSNAPSVVPGSSEVDPLPSHITKDVKLQIYSKVRDAFNSKDFASFWNLFSDVARSEMNKEDTEKIYRKLLDYFGGVEEGTFSHYEYKGRKGNLKAYCLYYNANFSAGSKFGNRGELQITITDDGREYSILSVNLWSKTR